MLCAVRPIAIIPTEHGATLAVDGCANGQREKRREKTCQYNGHQLASPADWHDHGSSLAARLRLVMSMVCPCGSFASDKWTLDSAIRRSHAIWTPVRRPRTRLTVTHLTSREGDCDVRSALLETREDVGLL